MATYRKVVRALELIGLAALIYPSRCPQASKPPAAPQVPPLPLLSNEEAMRTRAQR